MRLEHISISRYRSIEHIEISFPQNKPVVLFGPNNAGKSNILSAINRLLGERYPTYIEMLDSDYFKRDKINFPTTDIYATFDEPLFYDRYCNGYKTIGVHYDGNDQSENILCDETGKRIYPSNEDRAKCQSYLIDAERNIQSAFNYSSRYSLLSKFSHKIPSLSKRYTH
jgi:putative ATP-dependent endonuclease of OLD family